MFNLGEAVRELIVIGASTGGTKAVESLLTQVPGDTPPIVVVQHILPEFSSRFVEHLSRVCHIGVVEAVHETRLVSGTAYVAPGGAHTLVEWRDASLRALVVVSPAVNFHRPSVDLLFQSAAQLRDVAVVGVVLTGMGHDGAQGMVALRQAGAETIAQDEHSSVVFGMPKAAIERGGAAQVATLTDMVPAILESLGRLRARRLAVRRPAGALR